MKKKTVKKTPKKSKKTAKGLIVLKSGELNQQDVDNIRQQFNSSTDSAKKSTKKWYQFWKKV